MADSTARLLGQLYAHLTRHLEPRALRRFGWFDFTRHDRPDTVEARSIAFEAFCYLSLDEAGNWNGVLEILQGVVGFLIDRTDIEPSPRDLQSLRAILAKRPINTSELEEWFYTVWPRG